MSTDADGAAEGALDGAGADPAAPEGAAADGASPDGAASDGAASDGAAADGAARDGAAPDGAAADGASPYGAASDGAARDGAAAGARSPATPLPATAPPAAGAPGTPHALRAADALDALAGELRRVVALADPVPDGWRAVATAAFGWAAIDAAAAVLVYDSQAVQGGRVGTTHATGSTRREMRFAAGALAVELELDVGDDAVRVVGRLLPGRAVDVVALWPGGQVATTSEGDGSYRFDDLPRRPLCLHVAGAPALKTGWIVP